MSVCGHVHKWQYDILPKIAITSSGFEALLPAFTVSARACLAGFHLVQMQGDGKVILFGRRPSHMRSHKFAQGQEIQRVTTVLALVHVGSTTKP
jgi:hypothetical protein